MARGLAILAIIVIGAVLVGAIFGAVLIAAIYAHNATSYAGNISVSTPAPPAQPTSVVQPTTAVQQTTAQFQCPSPDQVSAWMDSSVSQVTSESCAFHDGDTGQQLSGVVCTNQDGGTTIEYTPISEPNTLIVQACDGSQLPAIWGFTIRFIGGYPAGDAGVCSVAQKAPNYLPSNWTVQPSC